MRESRQGQEVRVRPTRERERERDTDLGHRGAQSQGSLGVDARLNVNKSSY